MFRLSVCLFVRIILWKCSSQGCFSLNKSESIWEKNLTAIEEKEIAKKTFNQVTLRDRLFVVFVFVCWKMEVYETEKYYIFSKEKERKSLWWNRTTSEFQLKCGKLNANFCSPMSHNKESFIFCLIFRVGFIVCWWYRMHWHNIWHHRRDKAARSIRSTSFNNSRSFRNRIARPKSFSLQNQKCLHLKSRWAWLSTTSLCKTQHSFNKSIKFKHQQPTIETKNVRLWLMGCCEECWKLN